MSRTTRVFRCPPDAVFEVLADGWRFPSWVVGAARTRAVDSGWPAPGTRLHHSFGVWPFVIDDVTVAVEWLPPIRAVLNPHGWPIGEAQVTIEVKPRKDGSCLVSLSENPVRGPGSVLGPLLQPMLAIRNVETLRRLAAVAERPRQ